ncbi:thioredoxin domain-containing protein [Microbacterium gorillae]|uniref:thioredoxin domain-containing protein n=1 Tax=Microbacterium gorillae TaxID=1231063 RepID=UPI000591151A|nr:DUF255 domain-containing protein [Microbacterium gorillae]
MTSRLADAVSPYLRAHATNPVSWYPWGEEAFAAARERDVPVLVSIGYSSCHWCHVMARESFADPDTAALINADFVAIKVDREEHPEVDRAFLAAAAAFTRDLGWPLTVFTTPEGLPFYAGTYWPDEDRGGLPAFRTVLTAASVAWRDRRGEAERIGDGVRSALTDAAATEGGDLPDATALAGVVERILAGEDPAHGGFPSGPAQFPVLPLLRFLLDRDAPDAAHAAARRALSAMRTGDLFDRVDGGLFRYATRRDWSEPHYERMLTDNAQLIDVALDAGDADTAQRVAGFLRDVLQQPSGGFGASQDAESVVDGRSDAGAYYRVDPERRRELTPPAVDDKIVTGWNGLAIAALSRAGVQLNRPELTALAVEAALAVIEDNLPDAHWRRASRDGVPSRAGATPADLGQLATGLLRLALATGEVRYATLALELLESAARLEPDGVLAAIGLPADVGATDGDEPSGDAARAEAELLAWWLGAGDDHRERAAGLVRRRVGAALAGPRAYGTLLRVAAGLRRPPRQIIVVGDPGPLADAARTLPADVLAVVTPAQARAFADAGFDLFADRAEVRQTTAFVCAGFVCRLPVTDPADLV